MENDPTPAEAAAALRDADASAASMAGRLRLPSYFYSSIGAAIMLQIATSALGIAVQEVWAAALLLAGLGLFVAVAVVQMVRFRRENGAWVWALANRVVLGSDSTVSIVYCLAFAAAVVAAVAELWWLVPPAAVAGGVGYVLAGKRWLRGYREHPAAHARGLGFAWFAAACLLAAAGLVLLLVAAR
jgi:hypothetical protein